MCGLRLKSLDRRHTGDQNARSVFWALSSPRPCGSGETKIFNFNSQEEAVSKFQKFVVASLCLALLAGTGFAQKITHLQVVPGGSPYIKDAKPMFATIPRIANAEPAKDNPDVQIPIWTGTFMFNGQTFTYHMVGTDPAGGASSSIPLVIVPLKFHFTDGTNLSASQTVCGDVKNTKFRVKNSPVITKTTTFTPGGTNVGKTQYVDAYQRANFWSQVSTSSPN